MINYFKAFWFLIVLKAFTGVLLLISYVKGVDLIFLFKVPLILSILVIIIFHIQFKIYKGFIFYLFLVFTILSVLVSIYFGNDLSMKTISHLYGVLMAVFGVSFGRAFAKNYSKKMDYLVDKYIGYLFWVSAGIMVVYYYFYYVAGVIEYFGFDSELPLVIAFFLGLNKRFYTLVSILLLFFSGKRSPLISSLVMVLLLWNKNFRILSPKSFTIAVIIGSMAVGGVWYAYQRDFLWRYESLLSVDLYNEDSFYIATSGRSAEFVGVYKHMNAEPVRWAVGSGLGGSYFIDIIRGDYEERYQHYTHLSILSYVFLFGVIFTLLLLTYMFRLFYKNYKYVSNKYYLALVVTFIGAFFGASMLVDPTFWVLLGINSYMVVAGKDDLIVIGNEKSQV